MLELDGWVADTIDHDGDLLIATDFGGASELIRSRKHGLAFHVASAEQPAASSARTDVLQRPSSWVALLSLLAEAFASRTRRRSAGGAA